MSGGANGENQENREESPVTKSPDPMSSGEWEKELADIKGDTANAPELPRGPGRLPTPPPGGFKVPSLDKPAGKTGKRRERDRSEPPSGADKEKEPDRGGPEDIETEPLNVPAPGESPDEVPIKDITKALKSKSSKEAIVQKAREKAHKERRHSRISVLLSVLLFFVLAFSVAAGYHFRARQGVAYYLQRLKSEDPGMQSYARDSLGSLGEVSVPALKRLAETECERDVIAAVDTLALIDCEESVKILMGLTTHQNANVRKRALGALGERAAPQAFSNVVEQISSTDHQTRLCAITALEGFDPRKSVPELLTLLDDEDWQIRNEAAKTLTRITGQNLGIPKSTTLQTVNRMIRDRWRRWWQENGPAFQRPHEGENQAQ